jgi:hypothetical protein
MVAMAEPAIRQNAAAAEANRRLTAETMSAIIDAGIMKSGQAVDLIHSCAGTTGIRNESKFQQYFRDVHTVSQHAFSTSIRFESVGKLMPGKETDWVFYYL